MDLNLYPYFDDYDAAKKFYRILYRPTFGIQTRELIQQQTILQEQIRRFGDHIFENGAMVIPGQITFDNTITFQKMVALYGTADVVPTDFLGYTIIGEDSGLEAVVMNVAPKDDTDPLTFYIKTNNSGSNNRTTAFWDGETVYRQDDPSIKAICQGVLVPDAAIDYAGGATRVYDFSGKASVSSIGRGTYYINGMFVDIDDQSIVAGKYTDRPSIKIGLRLFESIITENDDSSLNENAQGTPNYAAPGAHRLKMELRLETLDLTTNPSTDFIELQRIDSGRVVKEIRTSEYNELEKTFARRTFDESGNYTVNPFTIIVREHLRIDGDDQYGEGVYYASEGGDANKVAIEVSPGKSYVQGFEIHKMAPTIIAMDRARELESNNNSVTNFLLGNYIRTNNLNNIPRIDQYGTLELYDTISTAGHFSGTKIGTAKVRAIVPEGTVTGSTDNVYRIYLFDIRMLETNPGVKYLFADVKWLYDSNEVGFKNFTAAPILINGTAYLNDTSRNSMIFRLPHEFIKTLLVGGGDTNYASTRAYYNIGVIANEVTLTAQANEVFSPNTGMNYIVSDMTNGGAIINPATLVFSLAGSPTGKVLTISGIAGGITNISVVAPISKQLASEKTKTLIEDQTLILATPNKVANGVDLLRKADVLRVKSIHMSDNPTKIPTTLMADVTSRYSFDNGQRDNYYDVSKIILKSGSPAPVGQLLVTFDYFTHSPGDYFSVDSYVDVTYEEIPTYSSNESGNQYFLGDCYDFRPRISDDGSSFVGAGAAIGEIPAINTDIRADYQYYLSQINKLYLDRTGDFAITEGVPAVNPKPPSSPETGMVIYDMTVRAYTLSTKDVVPKFLDNRRYTMADIGKIDKRLSNVEYYTALSLLERETASMDITDDAGLSRFKNGFIVDPFMSHGIGEATHPDYKCAVHPQEGNMRPRFNSESVPMRFNASESLGVRKTGPVVTLDFIEVVAIQQLKGSLHENINPFAVRTFKGEMKFSPDSDNWYDTEKVGELIVNNDANFAALEFIAKNAQGLNGITWNNWQTMWSSKAINSNVDITRVSRQDTGISHDEGWIQATVTRTTTVNTTSGQQRTGMKTVPKETTIDKQMGDRTVGMNYIPYMRSIPVLVKVEKMKPNTLIYPFFDGLSVKDHVTPARRVQISNKVGKFQISYGAEETVRGLTSGATGNILFQNDNYVTMVNVNGAFTVNESVVGDSSNASFKFLSTDTPATGSDLTTGDFGEIALIFNIPNITGGLQFKTGEREFVLSDQINNAEANQTVAKGIFKSQGSMLKQEGTVLSTKTIRFDSEPISQNRIANSSSTSVSKFVTDWRDPLAETFMIEEPGGCFITSLDVYFQSKDNTLPVTCQIREVVNGYPGSRILPYSEITLNPEDVIIGLDKPGLPTKFVMDAPIYLNQGAEYCFVLMTDSFNYNVWVGEVGGIDLVSGEMISKQPYNGVLFKSQNASTWSADQNQDMMFTIYKAQFNIDAPGLLIIDNDDLPYEILDNNPIVTQKNNHRVRVIHKNHGLAVGSTYQLAGFVDGTSYNGVLGSALNGDHTVTDTEIDSFVFELGSNALTTGTTGGPDIVGIRNYQMDVFCPNFTEVLVPGTANRWSFQSVSGQSVSGTQTPHQAIANQAIINMENYSMPIPAMVMNKINEDAHFGGVKSLKCGCAMTSENRNISPVVDVTRSAAIVIANRIDQPQTSLYNTRVPSAGPPIVLGTFTINPGEDELLIVHPDHELGEGAWIGIAGFTDVIDSGFIPDGWHQIRVIDKDQYLIDMGVISTVGYVANDGCDGAGTCTIEYSSTHYLYVPEEKSSGCSASARYITKQMSLLNPAESFRLMFGAVRMQYARIDVYFRTKTPHDSSQFNDIEWIKVPVADVTIPISESLTDFKDHEYTVEMTDETLANNPLIEEPYNALSVKLVMTSIDSTQVPIVTDLRIIALT